MKKNSDNLRGVIFLTHTVDGMLQFPRTTQLPLDVASTKNIARILYVSCGFYSAADKVSSSTATASDTDLNMVDETSDRLLLSHVRIYA